MTEMTERDRLAFRARTDRRAEIFARYRNTEHSPEISDEAWAVIDFVAMHDAIMAHDAAQKPAEPVCKESLHTADPVATAREAVRNLPTTYGICAVVANWRGEGKWAPCDSNIPGDVALAAVVNALPALLERAERPVQRLTEAKAYADARYREGVIKGLERAHDRLSRDVNRVAVGGDADLIRKANAAVLACSDISKEIARIRNGGAIDGETGGTTSGPGDRAGQDRGLTAPDGQTQAGGAPGLPTGWLTLAEIAGIELNRHRWVTQAGYPNVPTETFVASLRMARAAIKMHKDHERVREICREILTALETDNG